MTFFNTLNTIPKRLLRFLFKLVTACIVMVSFKVLANVVTYQIKKGDTLSNILLDHRLKPLYGKKGLIKFTTELNKTKIKKNGNFIRAGETIKLPKWKEGEKNNLQNEIAQEKVKDAIKKILEKSRAPSDEYPYSRFIYSPHMSFLRIDASNDVNFGGSIATALSQTGAGVDISWNVVYDDRFSFFGFAKVDYFSFYKDPIYSLNRMNIMHLHFGGGGKFVYTPELRFTSKISLREVSS